jgi:hypothetical protein
MPSTNSQDESKASAMAILSPDFFFRLQGKYESRPFR